MIIFSIILSILSFTLIFFGFVLQDVIPFQETNWRYILLLRFLFHIMGVSCIAGIFIYFRVYIKASLIVSTVILILINLFPLLDQLNGLQHIQDFEIIHKVKSEYRSSSKFNTSTFNFLYVSLKSKDHTLDIREDQWQVMQKSCHNNNPEMIKYLKFINKIISWNC